MMKLKIHQLTGVSDSQKPANKDVFGSTTPSNRAKTRKMTPGFTPHFYTLPPPPLRQQSPCSPSSSAAQSPAPQRTSSQDMMPTLLLHLYKFYGHGTSWRSQEQKTAVKALVDLQQDVIVVLPTGIGKTAIAILPSTVEDGVTVIVVPLRSLLDDWKRRLQKLNVRYEHFVGAANPTLGGATNIVLVSSDVIRYPAWRKAVAALSQKRTVVRFVFDECHYYVTDVDFRSQAMANPHSIRANLPCQFVLMSATLPPGAREWLAAQFPLTSPLHVTTSTSRPELKYIVRPQHISLLSIVEEIRATVPQVSADNMWTNNDRYLIFASSIKIGQALASSLGLNLYHANSDSAPISDEERERRLHAFLCGDQQGLVCTTALAAGFDYPHIRLTINVGTPGDLILFGQQTGRAGRDGKRAICLLYPMGYATSKVHPELCGVEYMNAIVGKEALGSLCVRWNLGKGLDGKGALCKDHPAQYEWCYFCRDGKFFTKLSLQVCVNFLPPDWIPPVVHLGASPATPAFCSSTQGMFLKSNIQGHLTNIIFKDFSGEKNLKRRLSANFETSRVAAHKLTTEAMRNKQESAEYYQRILQDVAGNCGSCYLTAKYVEHGHSADCPTFGPKAVYKEIQSTIHYPQKDRWRAPCYRCHIHSFGSNTLHPEFSSSQTVCEHKALMLPLMTHVWNDSKKRHVLQQLVGTKWNTLSDYIAWLEAPIDKAPWCSSMVLLALVHEHKDIFFV